MVKVRASCVRIRTTMIGDDPHSCNPILSPNRGYAAKGMLSSKQGKREITPCIWVHPDDDRRQRWPPTLVTLGASNAADVCPLSGVNRTPRVQRGNDANDPDRTSPS